MLLLTLTPSKLNRTFGPFAHIDEAPRAVFHLVSADSDFDPGPIVPGSEFDECRLKIQLLFVDRSRAARAAGIQTAFQFHERPNVLAVVSVNMKHVSLVEEAVGERLLPPVIVFDPFPRPAKLRRPWTGTSRSAPRADECI